MKGLSFLAKGYIWSTLLLGGLVAVSSLLWLPGSSEEYLAFAAFAALMALSQLFPVVTPRNQAYYLNMVFLLASLLLLPPGGVALVIILAAIPEWIKVRYPWYIATFNVANLLLSSFLARAFYTELGKGLPLSPAHLDILLYATGAAVLLTLVNHLLLAIVLRLARRQSWRDTGLFDLDNFLTDATLGCLGITTALLWRMSPWAVLLATAPLFLIYRALNMPNLKEQARTDAKTGLYNAKYFFETLAEELQRAARFQRPASVIMADMDLLRNINNTYGHLAGDVVLKGVADVIRSSLREYDVAARFGGEEFVVLLPETAADGALITAERLRRRVEEARFNVGTSVEPIRATLSLGVAAYPVDGDSAEELIHQADLAVYYAKLLGRNRTWCSSPESRALITRGDRVPSLLARVDAALSPYVPTAYRPADPRPGANGRGGSDVDDAVGSPTEGKRTAEEERLDGRAGEPEAEALVLASGVGPASSGHHKRASDPPWSVILAVALIASAGVFVWFQVRPWEGSPDWAALIMLALMTLVAQYQVIPIYNRGSVSTGGIVVLAGGMLFGVAGALILGMVIPVTQWVRSRGLAHRSVFDIGNTVLWSAASVEVYRRVAALMPERGPLYLLIPALLAAATYYVVNVGLLSIVMGLSEKRWPRAVWEERFRWLFVDYLAYGVVALATALAYEAVGAYGVLAFFFPLLLMRYVMKQYIDRTEENVRELRRVNEELVKTHAEVVSTLQELRGSYDTTIQALSAALDSRDSETEGHSRRVVSYVRLIAKELMVPDEALPGILNGALLHDVGKIGVPDAILRKPGALDAGDWAVMRTHPAQGFRMLQHIDFLRQALPVVRHHHEHYDGTGYPDGLEGHEIPLGARVFAVADAFDAMTSDRPYRAARSCEAARREIARCAKTQFDPEIVDAFLRIDVAELVRLSDQPSAGAARPARQSPGAEEHRALSGAA